MTDFFKSSEDLASNLNSIQPVADDFFADGSLDQYARIDHQHPLSESLRTAIYNSTLYVKKSGGTISGNLIVTGSGTFNSVYLPNGGNSLLMATDDSYISFFNAAYASRRGYLQGSASGLVLNSESGKLYLNGVGGIQVTPFTINGYTGSEGTLGYRIVVTTSAGYIVGNYINMTANVVSGYPPYLAGQSGDNYMRWYDKAGQFLSARIAGNQSAADWGNCAIAALPFTANAAICFHTGSVAPVIGNVNGYGNAFFFRDAAFNGNTGVLYANSYNADSTRRWKKNINNWPLKNMGSATERVTDLIAKLRTVTFQSNIPDSDLGGKRRSLAHLRLNRLRAKQGREPYELPAHDCVIHNCNGTIDNPCIRKMRIDTPKIGFIAEEVNEIFPEIVHLDLEKLPLAIDIGQLLAISIAAIQELTERINLLEGVT